MRSHCRPEHPGNDGHHLRYEHNGYDGYHRHDHRGDTSTTGIGGDQAKVCVLRHEHKGKNYHWVWDVEALHLRDKVVKDKFCD